MLKFERILETYLGTAPRGLRSFLLAGPLWIKEKLFTDRQLREDLGYDGEILYAEHHESHAASAFFPSPFEEAAFLTMDGVGEWATTSFGVGRGNDIEILKEIHWPDSLGLLYSAFTYYTGFKVNSGEYKVMGLAPYGEPKYVDLIYRELIDLKEDGSFALNQRYFNYLSGLTMTNGAFDQLFGGPPREPESKLTQREMDLARSVQVVCEEVMLRMARTVHRETGLRPAVPGGRRGAQLRRQRPPAAGGPVQGALDPARGRGRGRRARRGPARLAPARQAAAARHAGQGQHAGRLPRPVVHRRGDRDLPPLASARRYRKLERAELLQTRGPAARRGEGGGLVQRPDGVRPPRARRPEHPGRSAQPADAGADEHQDQVPRGLPSVRAQRAAGQGAASTSSSTPTRPTCCWWPRSRRRARFAWTTKAESLWGIDKLNVVRSDIPAVTHIDYSARIQTVSRDTNPDYYDLIHEFECLTGCAVLVNTSFNVRGEPIVCSPADAYRCFMRTHLDHLVLGPYVLDKPGQPEWKESGNWKAEFQLD